MVFNSNNRPVRALYARALKGVDNDCTQWFYRRGAEVELQLLNYCSATYERRVHGVSMAIESCFGWGSIAQGRHAASLHTASLSRSSEMKKNRGKIPTSLHKVFVTGPPRSCSQYSALVKPFQPTPLNRIECKFTVKRKVNYNGNY